MYRKEKGFSLVELMIVVAIVGILMAIVLPNYTDNVRSSVRTEGMTTLLEVMSAQENFFANDYTYTTDLTELNYAVPLTTERGDYIITAEQCVDASPLTSCVRLVATAQDGQAADGNLTLNSRGEKTHDGNNQWIN